MEFELTPIVTEKATKLTEKLNRYTFRVSPKPTSMRSRIWSKSSTAYMLSR